MRIATVAGGYLLTWPAHLPCILTNRPGDTILSASNCMAEFGLLSKIREASEDDFGPWIVRQAAALVDLELEVLRIAVAPGLHT